MNKHKKKSDITKNLILDAAEVLFLEKGFDGTSLSMISKAAKVNQSLLSHHFGSKSGLWKASSTRLYKRYLRFQEETLERPEGDGLDVLRDSISGYFHFLAKNPEAIRFRAWTFLSDKEGDYVSSEKVIEKGVERLRLGQEAGLIRKDIPPEFIWASFISLSEHWFQLREEHKGILQSTFKSEKEMDEKYLDSLLKIFFEGIEEK